MSLSTPSGSPSSPRPPCFTIAATSRSLEGPLTSGKNEPPHAQVLSSDPQCTSLTGGAGFRSIHLGDLNLLTEVGSEETLKSELVEQVGRQDITVRREVIVASRTVYRARVFGSQNPMTAVVYRGAQLEKATPTWNSINFPLISSLQWITEAEKRQNLLYLDNWTTSHLY